MKSKPAAACPCGGTSYAQCCAPYLERGDIAPTAEKLMRSRYTAYTLKNEPYLRQTWHASTRPSDHIVQDEPVKWLGLEVRKHVPDGDKATVEFVARYKLEGRAHRLHETSRFVHEDGHWFYLDGSFHEDKKTT